MNVDEPTLLAPLHLSRLSLRTDADPADLAPLFLADGVRDGHLHRLLWQLFTDIATDVPRPFLWREQEQAQQGGSRVLYVLSDRLPQSWHPLFRIDTRPFAPALQPGDRLSFHLRANATIANRARRDAKGRGKREDIVMAAIHDVPTVRTDPSEAKNQRAEARERAIHEQGRAWLLAQLQAAGATSAPEAIVVEGYRRRQIPRDGRGPNRRAPMVIGTLDFAGHLTVQQPGRFLARLAEGFGRARAFGCGLMLIRRA